MTRGKTSIPNLASIGDDPVIAAVDALGRSVQATLNDPDSWDVADFFETWTRHPDDPRQWVASIPSTRRLHPRVLFQLENTPAWNAVTAALKADPILGRVVDQLVGDGMAAAALQSFGLITQALQAWTNRRNRQYRLSRLLASWRQTFGSKYIDVSTDRVVFGLKVGRPLQLTSRITLRRMSDAEVSTALSLGAISATPRFGGLVFLETPACLTYRERMPLRIGEPVDLGQAQTYQQGLALHEEAAATALRLAGVGHFRLGPSLRRIVSGGQFWSGSAVTADHFGLQTAVVGRTRRKVRSIGLQALAALEAERALAIALRRFSQSHEGRHEQDRFLDLWIAMEALFGSESSTEVLFQLAINTANYLQLPGVHRRTLFDWLKKCYRVRSELVHGSRASIRTQKRLDGRAVQGISELSDDLALIVRETLIKRLASRSDPDWIAYSLDLTANARGARR
jgi:hypothetical protein